MKEFLSHVIYANVQGNIFQLRLLEMGVALSI